MINIKLERRKVIIYEDKRGNMINGRYKRREAQEKMAKIFFKGSRFNTSIYIFSQTYTEIV